MQHLDSDNEKPVDENLDLDTQEEKISIWKIYSSTFLRLLLIALIFAALAWYMLDNLYNVDDHNEIPVIKSDDMPIKIKPEDPGGMIVPNMDKDVYNNLMDGNNIKPQEHVLPTPEEPLTPDNIIETKDNLDSEEIKPEENQSSEKPLNQNENINNNTPTDTTNNPSSAITDNSTSVESNMDNSNLPKPQEINPPTPEKNDLDIEQKPIEPAPNNDISNNDSTPNIKPLPSDQKNRLVHKNTRKTISDNGYKIQLAAFKSQKEVEIEWKKIKTRYANIIGKNTHSVEKKDLGSKGIFYRLQVGPINNEAEARMLCQKLTSHKQNCFVVKK